MEKELINQVDPVTGMYGIHRYHIDNSYSYECNYVLGKVNGCFTIWCSYRNNQLRSKSYYVDNVAEGERIKYDYDNI